MNDSGCNVDKSGEAPFVMSQLLSKLDPKDNVEFGREMFREHREENASNLIAWLHREATLRSRAGRERRIFERTEQRAASNVMENDVIEELCPLGCQTRHLLTACPIFQGTLTVDQRWEVVRRHNRCRKCLRTHHTNECRKPDGTTCDQCTRRHHRFLHSEAPRPLSGHRNVGRNQNRSLASGNRVTMNRQLQVIDPSQSQEPERNDTEESQNTSAQFVTDVRGGCAICPVQKVKIEDSNGNQHEVLAMLDSGSNTSLLSKSIAKKLNLKGTQTHLTMNLAGGQQRSEGSEILNVVLRSLENTAVKKLLQVYSVKKPCSSAKTLSRKGVECFPHLKPLSDHLHLSGGAIDLLIGTDFSDAFIDLDSKNGESGDPVAKRNLFGWYVIGQLCENSVNPSRVTSVHVGSISVLDDVKTLFTQDLMGVKPTALCTCSDETLKENKFIKSVTSSTQMVHGRLQVRMPWKLTGPPKRSNFDIALTRMYSTEKTFIRKNCYKNIETEIKRLIEQGFVTKVHPQKISHVEPEWYLPLQAVFTPERSTQIRLVFDASAKGHENLSLNDYLEKGPNYINDPTTILLAWRWESVAYTGDIRKMFNQVLIHPDDQVYHRFLWRKEAQGQPTVYQWQRLNFGDKPAPDIAISCVNTLAKLAENEFPEAAKEIRENSYVDDIGGSKHCGEDAKHITKEIDKILAKEKFEIKAWNSNHKYVDQTKEKFSSFLGHKWDKSEDTISFAKQEIEKPAFACTAIDMFGPIQIRLSRKTLKEAQIIIFACMTPRDIHLELVTDRTTNAFLMAFRRFACTRGHPAVCWSDHGTNFVAAQDYLREICKLENKT
ncbi:uncharacterized protein [Montipora capricornis]|uniref:uncharacterized protein n=1 Tax=Montipora capricornis TaxID=246305 RepID=UPI0035F1DB09